MLDKVKEEYQKHPKTRVLFYFDADGTVQNKYVLKHLQYLREEVELLRGRDKSGVAVKEDLKLRQKFERDIVECEKYVEVLKGIADFEIDLDDGVGVNIEKFGKAVVGL